MNNEKNKIKKPIVFVWIFLLILVVPTLLFFILPSDVDIVSAENRNKSAFPTFDWKHLDDFPPQFNSFYDDNFSLRPLGVTLYNRFNYFFLKKSPDDSKAILGEDNWIFQGKDLDHYRGLKQYTESEQAALINEFSKRAAFLKKQNCKFLLVVIPSKKEIYPEFVPAEYFKYTKKTATDQLISFTKQIDNFDIIDLRPVLLQSKKLYPEIYHRYDHHWNDYGAFVAYDTIVGYMQQFWPVGQKHQISDYNEVIKETNAGSLAILLGVADKISFYRYYLESKFTNKATLLERRYASPERFPYPFAYEKRYQQSNDSLPRLMMVNDSFGEYLYPNLAEHASYSIFLFDNWEFNLHVDKLANENPDLFIICAFEAFIPQILDNIERDENKMPLE